MELWYKPGRKSTRARRRGNPTEQVARRRTVWTRKMETVYKRIADPITMEGLWHWRKKAVALRSA
eukprot:10827914-Karenia_brevis.AAC.1